MTSIESRAGLEPRRADLVAWYLTDARLLDSRALKEPRRASYDELARVHTAAWLESLSNADVLARIYGVDRWDVRVDELLHTARLACGATVEAARHALAHGTATLNLLGGFHHAAPGRGAGLCPVNDVAIAVAALRHDGFEGRIAILDLDAHPPDGTAACLEGDPRVWIGSLSGSDWGHLPGVDETFLPEGCGDTTYLAALDALLERMPAAPLVFVLAGGDVLAGDRLGRLGLTTDGARRRDRRVFDAVRNRASVWLPAGGYHRDAWRVLAGTALVLAGRPRRVIPPDLDPLSLHFAELHRRARRENLGPTPFLTAEEVEEALGIRRAPKRELLGFYTADGVEYALHHYGILPHIRRLGYDDFTVQVDRATCGDLLRLFGRADGASWLLAEIVLQKRPVAGEDMLFIHWLTLRNPRAVFSNLKPRLPGQDVPGLGMAREFSELLLQVARRLGLVGVAFCPAWYHIAYTMRHTFRFVDPGVQGRFEALQRDLSDRPLLDVTQAVAEDRIRNRGGPWSWEPTEMAMRFEPVPGYDARVAHERERASFTMAAPNPSRPEPGPLPAPPVELPPIVLAGYAGAGGGCQGDPGRNPDGR